MSCKDSEDEDDETNDMSVFLSFQAKPRQKTILFLDLLCTLPFDGGGDDDRETSCRRGPSTPSPPLIPPHRVSLWKLSSKCDLNDQRVTFDTCEILLVPVLIPVGNVGRVVLVFLPLLP